MTRRWVVGVAAALAAVGAAACGGDGGNAGARSGSSGPLIVSAAASMQEAFTAYGRGFDDGQVRFSFAGSDELAAQIRQGLKPDVFASANTKLPQELHAAGLVEQPKVFAGNRLVLAVPAKSGKVRSLADAQRPGVKLAVGSTSVPVGAYTRTVLDRVSPPARAKLLANVRSREPDVKGIVGKLTQEAVDAGFVYITDVTATKGALVAIELPASLQPAVAYAVAVVKGAKRREQAQRFIAGLLHGPGQRALRAAGFQPPPQ